MYINVEINDGYIFSLEINEEIIIIGQVDNVPSQLFAQRDKLDMR